MFHSAKEKYLKIFPFIETVIILYLVGTHDAVYFQIKQPAFGTDSSIFRLSDYQIVLLPGGGQNTITSG